MSRANRMDGITPITSMIGLCNNNMVSRIVETIEWKIDVKDSALVRCIVEFIKKNVIFTDYLNRHSGEWFCTSNYIINDRIPCKRITASTDNRIRNFRILF